MAKSEGMTSVEIQDTCKDFIDKLTDTFNEFDKSQEVCIAMTKVKVSREHSRKVNAVLRARKECQINCPKLFN